MPFRLQVVAALLWLASIVSTTALAQQTALPQVAAPFAGDPRLEPLPANPLSLANYTVFANGVPVEMRFPPRVNGQAQSDGDASADMFVLFYSDNGERVVQRPVIEAAPKGAAPVVSDLTARLFSSTWRLHAVTVSRSYDPNSAGQLIDTVAEVNSSPLVAAIYSTNIYLNAAVGPPGSTVPAGAPPILEAFYEGVVVSLAPGDVADGIFAPQVLFKFEDQNGNVLPSAASPHLVASRTAGDFFHSSIWEVWTVRVPNGFNVTQLTSRTQFLNPSTGVPIAPFSVVSSGIRLNAPVSSMNGTAVPAEDAFAFLTNAQGRFEAGKLPFDVPASAFQKQRTFLLTGMRQGGAALRRSLAPSDFPPVDPFGKGNVVPLILADPFQTQSSGPNTTGPFRRIDQAELDAAIQNVPPRLPAAIENNFSSLIAAGLLAPDWAPGARPYQERLALVGRAIHELVYRPEDGANSKDVTSCFACHSRSLAGGGGRALFNLMSQALPAPVNPGSIWGGGAAELLNALKRLAGEPGLTFAHGSLGRNPTLRGFAVGAPNTHFGVQSAEFVGKQTGNPSGFDPATDLDGDGVANEKSVGEVTAETVWMMTLPVPDVASAQLRQTLGISDQSLSEGRFRFRKSIDEGGAGCAACHRVFHPMSTNIFRLRNPQTSSGLNLTLPHHTADADDVAEGLASFVGENGLRLYGDFKRHKMGSKMAVTGTDSIKTAELWDAGSTFPYLRGGDAGGSLMAATLAHEGVPLPVPVFRGQQINEVVGGKNVSRQAILIRNNGALTIPASTSQPIRVVLAGAITTGVAANNAAAPGPDGGFRHGAVWLVTQSIAPQGSAVLTLSFDNPAFAPLQYDLIVETHRGYSEAAVSVRAFQDLGSALQNDIVNFLRAQVVGDSVDK